MNNQYKQAKTAFLYNEFNEYAKELRKKYDIKISLTAHYDTMLIMGRLGELKLISDKVLSDIIDYAKNQFNEEYTVFSSEPAIIYFGTPNETSQIWYTLERKHKDNEPD